MNKKKNQFKQYFLKTIIGNDIGVQGAICITEALKDNSTLEKIELFGM